jgi:hypothetical protein
MQTHTLFILGYALLAVFGLPIIFIGGLELAAYARYKWREYQRNYRRIANSSPSRFELKEPRT